MLRIARTTDAHVVLTLSGRLDRQSIVEVSAALAAEPTGSLVALDLADLVLADRDAIRFLRTCEERGVVLRSCPSYIRTWMGCEGTDSEGQDG